MRARSGALAAFIVTVGVVAVAAAVIKTFDAHTVWRAVEGADFSFLVMALILGAFLQVLRAQRAALLLRREHQISLEQCFGAQVLSHAVQSFVPIGPGGFGLQAAITRRLANIPMPFSAGVFVGCSILDSLTAVPLLCSVLFTMHLPQWIRIILVGALIRNGLFLLVPVIAALTRHRLGGIAPRGTWGRKTLRAVKGIEDGLMTIVAGGWRSALPAIALSSLITVGGMLRLGLVLSAFELSASPHQVALLVVMGGLMRSVPMAIPGADAWANSKLTRLVHVIGPGAGGFAVVSSVIAAVESPLLAVGVLLWWALPRSDVTLCARDLMSLARRPATDAPVP